ncbi:MAG: M14 family metallopeptidase [bacterium]
MLNRRTPLLRVLPSLLLFGFLCMAPGTATAQQIPSPDTFLGFELGADNKLAHWDQILEYLETTDAASERIQLVELGKSTLGRTFPMLIITSAENMRGLDRIKEINRRLYAPESISGPDEARRLISDGKAVVCITLNIHSTEIGASQMVMEAVHRLATEQSDYMQNILDNVVLLLFPSLNPDGQAMVVDWHRETLGTEYEGSRMPWLYHLYTGHDNNRDAYMFTQVETQHLGRVLYHDWFPEIWLDEHQMGGSGARIFLMPAAGPPNPNVDPWIYRTAGLLGFAQAQALDMEGKHGIVYGQTYTYWWQGAMAWTGWWHNMVGMLSEVASADLAAPVYQAEAPLGLRRGDELPPAYRDWPEGYRPPPRDTEVRPEYLSPWTGGKWTLRDIIDYENIITFALLDAAADMRENLLEGIYEVNRRTVEKGEAGDPYAILIPADQHDDPTVVKLVQTLFMGGVRIERATSDFTADGRRWPAGTYIIPMAQVFRNYAKDLLEPQVYPSEIPPYDVSGWSLGMQMGVETVFVSEPFSWKGETAGAAPMPAGTIRGSGEVFLLDPRANDSFTAALRHLRAGRRVGRLPASITASGIDLPPGAFVVEGEGVRSEVEAAVEDLGIDAFALPRTPSGVRWLDGAPRVGLYQGWGGNMDEGWTRYVLEDFEFDPIVIRPEDIRDQNGLIDRYDVILFPDDRYRSILRGRMGSSSPPRYRGGIEESGEAALVEFVEQGGTLVTLGGATDLALTSFRAPFRPALGGVGRDAFYCPGSLLQVEVDLSHPIAWGMPEKADVMYAMEMVLDQAPAFDPQARQVAVRFGGEDPLRSGWLRGSEHIQNTIGAATYAFGEGELVLLPLRVQRRAQTHGTYKLLFNPLLGSTLQR